MKTFRRGGVHPPEMKYTAADTIIECALPRRVSLPLRQHIGAEAIPTVKKGDHVERFQMVAQAPSVVSAPVHSPISGVVTAIGPVTMLNGREATAITIEASDEDHAANTAAAQVCPERRNILGINAEEILQRISEAGIVGLGGATFPTPVKLSPPPGMRADLLIINACECEPCLTCDDALMRAHPDEIVEGISLIMRAARVDRAIIGIEANKPEAFQALAAALANRHTEDITLQQLVTKYPQGGEKQLIQAITGREVPSGALPISTGCIVQNVATAYAVQQAVVFGRPLVDRVVTLVGIGNFRIPFGTMLTDKLFHNAIAHLSPSPSGRLLASIMRGEGDRVYDVVAGGPMMGASVVTLDAPVVKGTSGITVLSALGFDPKPCIRCAACVDACPMGLEPYLLATYSRFGQYAEAVTSGARDCMECGCCNYSCPSGRPIVDYIRLSKRYKPQ